MGFVYRCTTCRTKIPFKAGQLPEFCPNPECGTRAASDRDDDDIVIPFIRSAGTTANDALYRQMEQASERRAEAAAQMAGVPASEMSGLKITNLNLNQRAGDIAMPVVSNAVTQSMDAIRAVNPNANIGYTNGLGFSGAVASGPSPNAGARFQSVVRQIHAENNGWQAVGDAPALETQQPGYRRRT